jgi:PEP-CTERM motif
MTTSKKSILLSTFATLLGLVVLALPTTALAFSAAGDFSASSNPNGAWSYGSSTSLASAFIPSSIPTNNYAGLSLDGWLGTSDGSGTPYILHNATAHNVTNQVTVYQPGQLAQHPGAQDQYSVVRWTAPFSGTFSINATFSGLSLAGDTADVHILLDGISIFNSTVTGSPSPASFSTIGSLSAGDRIDFAVGFGSNGDNHDDTTGLSATIVPEPGTLALVAMGLASLLSFRFLKRK